MIWYNTVRLTVCCFLGLPGEHVQYIEADHRHICKFSTPTSPNYAILQRAFIKTIDVIKEHGQYSPQFV